MSEDLDKTHLDPSLGYTFGGQQTDRLRDGCDYHFTAHDRNGNQVGHLKIRYSGKTSRASTFYSTDVYVHPDHRRQGLASALYAHAERTLGKKVVPSGDQTRDGKALWQGNRRDPQFGKSELAKSTPEGLRHFEAIRPRLNAAGEKFPSGAVAQYLDRRDAEGIGPPVNKPALGPAAQAALRDYASAPITINLHPKHLPAIGQARRLLNFHDTGESGGTHTEERARVEETLFGIPHNAPGSERPVYGALHIWHQHPTRRVPGGAPGFGDAYLELKPHIVNRSTFTPMDSLSMTLPTGGGEIARNVGAKVDDPAQFAQEHVFGPEHRHHAVRMAVHGSYPYLEAQIHGGVDVQRDVAAVHYVHTPGGVADHTETVRAFAQQNGLKAVRHQWISGRPESQILHDPAQKSELAKAEGDDFAYHATTPKALKQIARQGLVPQVAGAHPDEERSESGPATYFSISHDHAAIWGPHVLRFPWPDDAQEDPYSDTTYHPQYGTISTNWLTGQHVPAEHIHVRQPDGSWKPLVTAQKSEDLAKMAIADIKPGKPTPRSDTTDYSHLLTPAHRKAGYSLHVTSLTGNLIEAQVHHKGQQVGWVSGGREGEIDGKPAVKIESSSVDDLHQGKGLGTAAYEAFLAHSYHKHGARILEGGNHTTAASHVHAKLAAKHGLEYSPGYKIPGASDTYGDGRYDWYQYDLKSEDLGKAGHPDTPEFHQWFQGSHVVDAQGAPQRVYHGTSKDVDFNSFKIGKRGSWFTSDPAVASQYANENDSAGLKFDHGEGAYVKVNRTPRVIPAYLSLKNPYYLTADDHQKLNVENYARAQGQFFDQLRVKGHDGVVMPDKQTFVAFHPHQVKTIFNQRPTQHKRMDKTDESMQKNEGNAQAQVALIMCYDAQGKLLLGQRFDSGMWTLPGGHLNPGEDPEEGARRELKEETGLDPVSLTALPNMEQPKFAGAPKLHVYTAIVSGRPHSHLDPDKEVAKWMFVPCADGLPPEVYDQLHGPTGKENVIRQMFRRGAEGEMKKAEVLWDLRKAEVLLQHHDPRERAIAVALNTCTAHDVYRAALDDDHAVVRSALARPEVGGYLMKLVSAARRGRGGKYPTAAHMQALFHPAANDRHVGTIERVAAESGPDAQFVRQRAAEARVAMAGLHKAEGLAKAEPLRPHGGLQSEPGYVYHATNEENAHDIAQSALQVHAPWHGTDQEAWPDGSTQHRSYHSANAGAVWAFAPMEGQPVVLRTHTSKHPFNKESTGDMYTTKPIPAEHLEIGLADGSWAPLKHWAGGNDDAAR